MALVVMTCSTVMFKSKIVERSFVRRRRSRGGEKNCEETALD
jgi:hypothetical protein